MSTLRTNNLSHRLGTGTITVPTQNIVRGTDIGSLQAPGMVIDHSYVRSDNKSTYSIPAAGSAGTFISELNISITPKSATSKILITYCIGFECVNDTIFRLYRSISGSDAEIGRNVNDPNYWAGIWHPGYDADNSTTPRTNQYFYLDTPGTTLPVTYKLMIQSAGTAASTFYLNRTISSTGAANNEVGISQVILQEIAQ